MCLCRRRLHATRWSTTIWSARGLLTRYLLCCYRSTVEGLPPGGDIATRGREIVRACLLVAPQEYHDKRYGEILNLITKVGGAIKHLAADKASSFHYILEHLVDIEVVRHDAPTAVSEMEADKDGVRFGLDTIASEVINSPNFYNLAVVVNTIEVPYQAVFATRTEQWYTVNQD